MLAYSYLRFSTGEQAKGDSVRRQVALRDALLARRGLTLDTSLTIADRGVSAFRGKNAEKGALGLFLEACESGRVRRGSYLIVENLDRLTRSDPHAAVTLFLRILEYGIRIVTVFPEQEFAKDNLDLTRLILAIAELCRGHSESLAKSERGKENWAHKRSLIGQRILTKLKPAWIDLVDGRFVVNGAKGKTVRLIFQLARTGFGIGSIAKRLNKEGVRPISRAKRWHYSYIHKILVNRACVGEFQPRMRGEDGKFHPVGSPYPNYFPPVVEDGEFAAAQQALRSRKGKVGRVNHRVHNLFTGLVWTEDGIACSARSRNYVHYLVPGNATPGVCENRPCVPYAAFESALLTWLREVDVDLEQDGADVRELEAQREDLEHRVGKIKERLRKDPDLDTVLDVLAGMQEELRQVREAIEVASIPKRNQMAHARNLIGMLEGAEDVESLRRQIKQQVAFVVERIEVRVEGKVRTKHKRAYCTVRFRNGAERKIWFETGNGVISGLWSDDGRFNGADLSYATEQWQALQK